MCGQKNEYFVDFEINILFILLPTHLPITTCMELLGFSYLKVGARIVKLQYSTSKSRRLFSTTYLKD